MSEHPLPVLAREVHGLDLDADDVGHGGRVDQVLARGAVRVGIVVFPVLHEQADDFVAFTLEQPSRNRRVYAAGKAEHDAVFGVHDEERTPSKRGWIPSFGSW